TTTTSTTTTTTRPPDTTPPSVPNGVNASAATCSQINVGWSASTDTGGSGLARYDIYRNGVYLRSVLAPTTSVGDTGLAASTAYSYTLAAVDNVGNTSSVSGAASATTPACTGTLNPTLVGFVPSVGPAYDVAIDAVNHLAYVATAQFGLSVVDVTTPSA